MLIIRRSLFLISETGVKACFILFSFHVPGHLGYRHFPWHNPQAAGIRIKPLKPVTVFQGSTLILHAMNAIVSTKDSRRNRPKGRIQRKADFISLGTCVHGEYRIM